MRYRMETAGRRVGALLCAASLAPAGFAQGEDPGSTGAANEFSRSTYTYKTVAECDIQADVYRLPGEDVRPAVMWIHGGALIFGNRRTVRPDQLERYLGAGYALVSIDYRLAPETKLADIVEDVQDAYRWIRANGPELLAVDPDRIALVGNSAGGYLALMTGASVTPRPRAIVSFYGYGDLTAEWCARADPNYLDMEPVSEEDAYEALGDELLSGSQLFPRVVFYNYCRQQGIWRREVAALDGEDDRRELERLSPFHLLTKEYPPTLLLHGDRDRDVPFEASERMAAGLERAGVPHRLVRMRDHDHLFDVFPGGWPESAEPIGLQDPEVAQAYDDVVAFLEEHVGRSARAPATSR